MLICSGSCHSLHLVNVARLLYESALTQAHKILLLLIRFHSISLSFECEQLQFALLLATIVLNCEMHFCCRYSLVATAKFNASGKRAFFTEPVTHSAARKQSVHLLLHIAGIRIITHPLKVFNKKSDTAAISVNLNS